MQDFLISPYDETAEALFKRGRIKPIKTGLSLFDTDLPAPLNYGDVVEIFGQSNMGKTEMLYHIIVSSILPNNWKDVPLGGNNSAVIHIDNDYHFCMTRLLVILENRIKNAFILPSSSSPSSSSSISITSSSTQKGRQLIPPPSSFSQEPISPQDVQDIILSALRRLFVINCKDTLQFVASLQTLHVLLDSEPNIRLLTIDSISSFYWLNKYEERDTVFHRQITSSLKKLLNKYMLLLFVTKGTKTIPKEGERDQDGLLQHVEYLENWDIVKYRVILCRPPPTTPPNKKDKVDEKKGPPAPFIAKVISPFSGPPSTNTTNNFVPHHHASGTTSTYKYLIDGNGIIFS